MFNVLRLIPGEVDTFEKRSQYTVNVIGCGERGIRYAIAFAEAGYKVICTDADQSLIKRLARGKTLFLEREIEIKLKRFIRTGRIRTTNEIKNSASQSNIVIITITPKIDGKKNPDFSEVENNCKKIGAALHEGALIIYGGITSFGFSEGVIKEILENTSGLKVSEDFGLAYNPVKIPNGQTAEISNLELMVAANDKASLEAASIILGTLTEKGIEKVLNVKKAELAVLFSVARQDANIALANELAILCEDAGIDFFETLSLLAPDTHKSFTPTISTEDSGNEVYLLLENAESLNTKLRLTTLARQINESMVKHVIGLVQSALRSCGKTLRRSRVAVIGAVGPNKAAEMIVRLLESKGSKVRIFNKLLSTSNLSEVSRAFKRSLNEAVEGTDCVVVLAGNGQSKSLNLKNLRTVMKMPAAIVDLTGKIEIHKVEKAGFIYRGLGRGAEKK